MGLPELIEIFPLQAPVHALISVPGSKSITNRALILAALAQGETTLRGALWSEDTQVMVECLQEMGFMVNVQPDPEERSNRTITLYGKGGAIPPGGTPERPLELFVANAGTAARFLTACTCLGKGVYRVHGVERMHQRPQGALFQAFRQLGYRVDSPNDKLPAVIHGGGPRPGKCQVSVSESSQFASALLLCAGVGGWEVEVQGQSEEELPYVVMTSRLIEAFPRTGSEFKIEPDASSGSYFWAVGGLPSGGCLPHRVAVSRWPESGWQADGKFPEVLARMRSGQLAPGEPRQLQSISRRQDLGDSIMTAIVLAPFSREPVRFTELGRLRVQECERVAALKSEMTRCGAKVIEEGDTLTVYPSDLHGAEIETYNDHRMAMCFAVVGLKVAGIRIRNPACVRKTFPDFFAKLSAAPPKGLGAIVTDARTGRALSVEDLFAD